MASRHKRRKQEINKVKEAVVPETPTMPMPPSMQEVDRIAIPSIAEPKQFAPLFIKIDRYREALQKLHKQKSVINNIHALLSVQDDIERLRGDSTAMLRRNLEEFSAIASQLDHELQRPRELRPFLKQPDLEKIDGYTEQLENEINKMKEKLKNI